MSGKKKYENIKELNFKIEDKEKENRSWKLKLLLKNIILSHYLIRILTNIFLEWLFFLASNTCEPKKISCNKVQYLKRSILIYQ